MANSKFQGKPGVLDIARYNLKHPVFFPKGSRFFVMKTDNEDSVYCSIKFQIWGSTDSANRQLDAAFKARQGPIFLLFSVSGGGHFQGIAQMTSPVNFERKLEEFHLDVDDYVGVFGVDWMYVKDVRNKCLQHIILDNRGLPFTRARNGQEVKFPVGARVMKLFHKYRHHSNILEDRDHYEDRLRDRIDEDKENALQFEKAFEKALDNAIFEQSQTGDQHPAGLGAGEQDDDHQALCEPEHLRTCAPVPRYTPTVTLKPEEYWDYEPEKLDNATQPTVSEHSQAGDQHPAGFGAGEQECTDYDDHHCDQAPCEPEHLRTCAPVPKYTPIILTLRPEEYWDYIPSEKIV